MYTPEHYAEPDRAVLFDLIRQHPLGTLVTRTERGLDANHIPFVLLDDAEPVLIAHVARRNPVWQDLVGGAETLILFQGAEGYVSPNWYPSKQQSEDQVPTWNYQVVHVRGRVEVVDDVKFVRGVVARLTARNEASQPHPWKMTDSTPAFIDDELSHIVGLRVTGLVFEAKFKLSQNRTRQDLEGAARGLTGIGRKDLAESMVHAHDRQHGKPSS